MPEPLVSILIPCYNAERWIAQCIESALAQTWQEKEIIVLNDGSTDGSLAIIRQFGDRIRHETGPNLGGNVARNRLLQLSKGDWLQYLDADDFLLPAKIASQMAFLTEHTEVDLVFGPVLLEFTGETKTERTELPIPEPRDPWVLLARWYLPQTGAPLWRREAVADVGGWKENQPCCQEHELYLRMLMAGKRFSYHSQGGAVYRQWSDQTVCKRNVPLVNRERLAIMRTAEHFLRDHGMINSQREAAFHHARFEMARSIWQYDQQLATEIMKSVDDAHPSYRPTGAAAPPLYRFFYRILGFVTTERMADSVRSLRLRRRNSPRNS